MFHKVSSFLESSTGGSLNANLFMEKPLLSLQSGYVKVGLTERPGFERQLVEGISPDYISLETLSDGKCHLRNLVFASFPLVLSYYSHL